MPESSLSVRTAVVTQFLGACIEEAPEGILAFDHDCRYVLWNRRMEQISGKRREDVLGRVAFEVFPFLKEIGEDIFFKDVLRGESPEARGREYRDPHGNSGFYDASFRPIRDQEGSIIGGMAHIRDCADRMRDITAEKRARQDAQKAEERLKLIASTTDVGTWYCDLPLDVLEWSAKTKEHFWLPADAVVTIDRFYERIHPEDRAHTRQAVERAITMRAPYDIDYRTVSDDGQIKWIRAIGNTFCDAQGKPIRFDGVTVDQTDRRNAEEALRRSERLATAGRLAATVAHEVNNPLEAVTNLIYLCQHDPNATDSIRSHLKLADEELRRVAHIVRQTLGFYRETSAPQRANLAELVSGVISLYQKRYVQKRVALHTEFDQSVEAVIVPGAIRQVMANLLSNALDACDAGDEVTVRVCARDQEAVMEVADSGHGISEANRAKLFEAFFTTKTDIGTGLGLWVSRGIIEKHQGRISVKSSTDPRHHGTVFTLHLPMQQQLMLEKLA